MSKNKKPSQGPDRSQVPHTERTLTVTFSLRMPITTLAALVQWQQAQGFHPRTRSEAVHAAIEALLQEQPRPSDSEALKLYQQLTRSRDSLASQLRVSPGGIEKAFERLKEPRPAASKPTAAPCASTRAPGATPHTGQASDPDLITAAEAAQLPEPDPREFRLEED